MCEGGGERTKVTRENDAELDNREGKRNKKIYDKLCKLFKSEQKEDRKKRRKRKRKEKKLTRGGGRKRGRKKKRVKVNKIILIYLYSRYLWNGHLLSKPCSNHYLKSISASITKIYFFFLFLFLLPCVLFQLTIYEIPP